MFPLVKRNKEFLHKLLLIRSGRTELDPSLDQESRMENLVEQVIKECRLKCFNKGREDHSIEMINVLINRLGAKFLTEEIIYNPLKNILTKRLRRRFGGFLKNIGVKDIDLGERYPLIKKVSKPWMNERGIWARLVISQTDEARSFTVEANQLKLPSRQVLEETSQSSESDSETGVFVAASSAASWIDQEMGELCFKLDILQFEMVFLINIPPPDEAWPVHLWVGLCHLPLLETRLAAQGAAPRLCSLLNGIMPVLKAAVNKKLNLTLEQNWIYPNMKAFPITFPDV